MTSAGDCGLERVPDIEENYRRRRRIQSGLKARTGNIEIDPLCREWKCLYSTFSPLSFATDYFNMSSFSTIAMHCGLRDDIHIRNKLF